MKKVSTLLREARLISRGLLSTKHPILAHLVPMRRCNLSCKYCNEYDKTSDPVPIETVKRRIDLLAGLGTSIITISGGYFMTRDRIEKLNAAGLVYLQISIDNVTPDEVSQKSLKVLDRYLRYLSE